MRHIILHNHLFKNAGTSVDHILKQNFPQRWVSSEFNTTGTTNTQDVANWITSNPNAIAFSSHTIRGPLPQLDDLRIIPVTMLRDPVDRIASAYRFERLQNADTLGTQIAQSNGFAGYVHARLMIAGDRQCRNFQTERLAALSTDPSDVELTRAKTCAMSLKRTGVLGFVAEFDRAMQRLQHILQPVFPGFTWQPTTQNASGKKGQNSVSPAMREMLEQMNKDDLALLSFLHGFQGQTITGALTDHACGMA